MRLTEPTYIGAHPCYARQNKSRITDHEYQVGIHAMSAILTVESRRG